MMFLVTLLIVILLIYSNQLSRNSLINTNDPIFIETISLKNQDKAYSILLHSITMHEQYISGYSDKFDEIITFLPSEQDTNTLQKKLNTLSPSIQECNACH